MSLDTFYCKALAPHFKLGAGASDSAVQILIPCFTVGPFLDGSSLLFVIHGQSSGSFQFLCLFNFKNQLLASVSFI